MSIPSDFDPLAWGERRYIQPIIKMKTYTIGVTDESYPCSFKMEVEGPMSNTGGRVWGAFDDDSSSFWGFYGRGEFYAVLTFEKPLRIVGLQMTLQYGDAFYRLYGIQNGEDPIIESSLLGAANFIGGSKRLQLVTVNHTYYSQYRILQHSDGSGWHRAVNIKLDAYYRPADLQG